MSTSFDTAGPRHRGPDGTSLRTAASLVADTREMRLLIRLLGPVDVVGDDGSVRQSGSALRRSLLALLAMHPGRVLAPDWLMEHVWGEEQPDSGLRALRFHVSQLRKEIGAIVPIETRPGGYRLDVARDSVDALIFEDQARRARTETDDARAADMCAAALELWRGAPFGDAAGCSTLDDEASRLEELHVDGHRASSCSPARRRRGE